jgi:hypothetical protein
MAGTAGMVVTAGIAGLPRMADIPGIAAMAGLARIARQDMPGGRRMTATTPATGVEAATTTAMDTAVRFGRRMDGDKSVEKVGLKSKIEAMFADWRETRLSKYRQTHQP